MPIQSQRTITRDDVSVDVSAVPMSRKRLRHGSGVSSALDAAVTVTGTAVVVGVVVAAVVLRDAATWW